MAVPGYSVTDLIKAVGKVKDVFDAFFNEFENAPRQLRELRGELQRLQDELKNLKQIEQEAGKSYSGRDALQRTLDECENFVKEHRHALQNARGIKSGNTIRGAIETGLFAFEQPEFERLLDHLNRRRIELIGFYVLLLLQRSLSGMQPLQHQLPAQESAPSSPRMTRRDSGSTNVSNSNAFQGVIVELRRINNEFTRMRGASSHGGSASLDERLQGCITNICELTGLPTGLLPQAAVEEYAHHSHTQLWQKVLETGGPSRYSGTRTAETVSRSCPVTIRYGMRKTIEATHYYMLNDTMHLYIYWFDKQDKQVLVHHLPRKCYPKTYHAQYKKPLHVAFPVSVRLFPPLAGGSSEDSQPDYVFHDTANQKQFQADARNRTLISQHDVSKISCRVKGNCDAQNVQVKLWRSRRDVTLTSLSMRVKQGDANSKDLDLYLRWLRVFAAGDKSCEIHFEQSEQIDQRAPTSRRHSSRGSIHTLATNTTAGSTSSQRAFDANEYRNIMGHITFDFASQAARDSFVADFKEARPKTPPPSRPISIRTTASRPPGLSYSPGGDTLTASPTSIRMRPQGSRSSTLATTPPTTFPVAEEPVLPQLPPPQLGPTFALPVDTQASTVQRKPLPSLPDTVACAASPAEPRPHTGSVDLSSATHDVFDHQNDIW